MAFPVRQKQQAYDAAPCAKIGCAVAGSAGAEIGKQHRVHREPEIMLALYDLKTRALQVVCRFIHPCHFSSMPELYKKTAGITMQPAAWFQLNQYGF